VSGMGAVGQQDHPCLCSERTGGEGPARSVRTNFYCGKRTIPPGQKDVARGQQADLVKK